MNKISYIVKENNPKESIVEVNIGPLLEAIDSISFAAITMLFEYLRQHKISSDEKENIERTVHAISEIINSFDVDDYKQYLELVKEK